MRPLINFLLVLIFSSHSIYGQINATKSINGIVVNAQTLEPIPYVNIGILHSEIGTLSNKDGSFFIKIPSKYSHDKLLFSSIGYQKKSHQINALENSLDLVITLNESIVELDEIVISSKKIKEQSKILGNGKSVLPHGHLSIDSEYAGGAMALLIDRQAYPNLKFIQKASLYITRNLMPSFKVRMRILAVDSTNHLKPGADILSQQIIQTSSIRKGWLDFSLKENHLIKENTFYLTFEWIIDKDDRKYISKAYDDYMKLYPDRINYDTTIINDEEVVTKTISTFITGTFFGTTTAPKDRKRFISYSRDNSFGKWERSKSILSAKIKLSNLPFDAKSETVDKPQEYPLTDLIDQWAKTFKEEQKVPGLQLAVLKKDSLIYSNAFGFSDKTDQVKVNPKTQFRIASISKTMTSAGLMKLVSQNKLDILQPIHHYVPSFPKKKYPITVKQLMGHLGGIRDYYGKSWKDELFIQKHYKNSTEAISIFSKDSLIVEPGSEFLYSSYGYILLGAVIEAVSNQPYLEYMQQEIWQPLNMDFTYGDISDSLMTHKSNFYFLSGKEASSYDLSYSYPSGGLLSTSENLTNFGSSLLKSDLFNQDIVNQIFKTQYTSEGDPTGYGLGWYIGKDFNDNPVWYHAGELPSSGSMLVLYPQQEMVIALLTNSPIVSDTEDGFSEEIQQLGELIYNYQ